MRILFALSDAPLPPFDGFQLAVRHLVDELRRSHTVRVLALSSRPAHREVRDDEGLRLVRNGPPGVVGNVRDLSRSLLLREPARVNRKCGAMDSALREELATFHPDVVHVSHSELARLALDLRSQPAVLACLDAWHRNVESAADAATALKRTHLRLQVPRVRRFEATEFRRFSHLTTVTAEDADALRELDPTLNVTAIPNGVDMPDHPPPRALDHTPRLLFHGAMGYAPNVLTARYLVEEILPIVREARPDVRLDLVGRKPSAEVEAFDALPGVHVSGEVPRLDPWMAAASVYVCPMISGTGIKNKLLEAMAYGVPSVASPLALQGIDAVPDEDLLVGDSAHAIATQVVRLLDDRETAERVGASGRDFVRRNHTWPAVASSYEDVYEAAIAVTQDATVG